MSVMPPKIWNTNTVPEREQFSFWREAVCASFLDLDVKCSLTGGFYGAIDSRDAGKFRLHRVDAQEQRVNLTESSHARKESFYINFQALGRTIIKQRNREATISEGQWCVIDSTEPFELLFDGRFMSYNFEIPFTALGASIQNFQKAVGQTLGLKDGLEKYLADYATALSKHIDNLGAPLKEKQCTEFLEMLISSITTPNPWETLRGPARVRREKIELFIDSNLENTQLSPSLIAKSCGLSVSTLHSIFNLEQETVMKYIWSKRLKLAFQRLQSASHNNTSISEIAYASGYSDLSHFYHGFRSQFGQTPKSIRKTV